MTRSIARRNTANARQEQGFVAVTTALLLVVLCLATALAIDVSIWYARANRLQRAADAAALAAVTQLPDLVKAQATANELARRNKIDPSMLTMNTIPNSPRALKISINDPTVPSFFGKVVRPSTAIRREAWAEYVPKITMGSPLNAIGTGNLPNHDTLAGATQGFWLAINGWCSPREAGDRYSAAFDGNWKSPVGGTSYLTCSKIAGVVDNLDYPQIAGKPQYSYVVEVPPTATFPVKIEVYSPHYDRSAGVNLIDKNMVGSTQAAIRSAVSVTTTFSLRNEQAVVVGSPQTFATCGVADGAGCTNNDWRSLYSVNAPGRYHVTVDTLNSEPNSFGVNSFSLRAYSGSSFAICSSRNSAACPNVSGAESMSVYAQVPIERDFYLAKLAPAKTFRGKRVQIQLMDPDTGAQSVAILKPTVSGWDPTQTSYRTWFPNLESFPDDSGVPLTGTAGPDYKVDVSGPRNTGASGPPWAQADRIGNFKYNGRILSIELTIPNDYGCAGGISFPCTESALPQDGWWRIRYNASSPDTNDRTTWNVALAGDPVHLIHP